LLSYVHEIIKTRNIFSYPQLFFNVALLQHSPLTNETQSPNPKHRPATSNQQPATSNQLRRSPAASCFQSPFLLLFITGRERDLRERDGIRKLESKIKVKAIDLLW